MERLRKIGFAKFTSLEDSLRKLFSHVSTLPSEEIHISQSLNRILAEDISSKIDVPPFDRAAMDGYAIRAEDSFGASPSNLKQLTLVGKIEIGQKIEQELHEGEAIRISTGAALPKGANAVIKIEETELKGNTVFLYASLVPGKNVSKKGEDILKDTTILTKGTDLKAEHVALLCSLGIDKVKVSMIPTVSIFSTGDELIEVGKPLKPNKIYNSNTPMLTSLVRLYGGKVIYHATLKDDKELIRKSLHEASINSHVIIFTGGTSVGSLDLLPEIMHEEANVLTHGIAMRPGSPLLIALFKESLVFCLPGTPVASYVGFLKVIGPTLRKMMGCFKIDPRIEIVAKISKDVPVSSLGHLNYLRVKIAREDNELVAIPVKLKGSGIISSLTQSDGIVEIPPFQEGLKKGEKVFVKLFPK
ncbi:MAG: molybdopterin molybdotransferase MoeA [Promethearchaeota archaeon]